jgi:DedD protein
LDLALKQRLVGAIVLIALAVIFLPMILDGSGTPEQLQVGVDIPEPAEAPESQFDQPDVESELGASESVSATGSGRGETADAGAGAEPAVTGWVVQVGSFSKEANAMVLRDRLQDLEFAAFVSAGTADGKSVWRVQVGPFPVESEAREVARSLEQQRDQPALVVSYP